LKSALGSIFKYYIAPPFLRTFGNIFDNCPVIEYILAMLGLAAVQEEIITGYQS